MTSVPQLRLKDFAQPKQSSLFLIYCFISNLRTNEQVEMAFEISLKNEWVSYNSNKYQILASMDVIVDGICAYFKTQKMDNFIIRQYAPDSDVLVSKTDGSVIYNPLEGYLPKSNTANGDSDEDKGYIKFAFDPSDHSAQEIVNAIANEIGIKIKVDENHVETKGEGLWYHGVADGIAYSAFYHPSKLHRASVKPGLFYEVYPSKPNWASSGTWAIAYAKAGFCCNEAYYDIKD